LSKAKSPAAQRTPFEAPTSGSDANASKPPAPPPPNLPPPRAADDKPSAVQSLPDLIILDRDFGFTLNGSLRTWAAGQPITKREQIAELLANDAPAQRYMRISDV